MNKIFKVIYSKTRHCYVVVSELAKSHCKTAGSHTTRSKTALTAAVLLALGTFSVASVFMPMTAEAADKTKTDGSNFVGVERTDGTFDDSDYANYKGQGAHGDGSITIGLKASGSDGTITIGDRRAEQSLGSVYVGRGPGMPTGKVLPDKTDNGYWATSVGYQSDATGYGSIAIGSNATANNSYDKDSTGHGITLRTTSGDGKTVVLNGKPDIQRASVAIGYGASADNGNIAIGSYSDASTDLREVTGDSAKAYLTDKKADSYVSVGKSDALRRISNVADGAADSDAATVLQLKKAVEATDASKKANIDASNIGKNLKYKADGKTAAESSDIKTNEDAWGTAIGTGEVADKNGQLVTGGTVYNAIQDKAVWKLTTNGASDKAATIKPGTTVDFSAEKNTKEHSNVTISHDGSNVTIGLDKDIVLGDTTHGNGGSLNVYSDSSDSNNLSNHVSINGSTISVNYPKTAEGKTSDARGVILGVGEEDSKPDGYIAFNNVEGAYTYLHASTDASDDKKGRLEYVGNDRQKKYIANLDDGITFKTDSIKGHIGSDSIPMKLNQTYTFSGDFGEGKTTDDLSNGNIAVVAQHSIKMPVGGGTATVTDDGFTVKLAKDLKGITSIGNQTTKKDGNKEVTTGAKIVLSDNGTTTISGGNVNVSQHKVTGLADGTDNTDAVTVQQLSKVESGKANIDASNIGSNYKGGNATANENAWGKALGTGSVTNQNGQLVTGGTVYNALQNQKDDLTDKLSVNAGWGINIDKTKGNTISLKRNLGTNELASLSKDYFLAAGENSLILGGAATAENVYINGQPWLEQFGAYGKDSVLVGGENNKISDTGTYAVISGGFLNMASGGSSFIGGGRRNTATGSSSAVVGGEVNTASGFNSIVAGGANNWATGEEASIWGGYNNYALKNGATVSGGQRNRAIGETSSVDGGRLNFAYGDTSQISGGYSNYALGNFSNSLGGRNGVVQGNGSVGIAGGSTGSGAGYALAAGYQSIVTTEAVHRTESQDWVDAVMEGGHLIGKGYKYTDVATALGYQATADAPSTISFGHDKGDVSGYTVDWDIEYEKDSHGNIKYDDDWYPIIKSIKINGVKTNYYDTAYYNRLVKAADGIEDHDAVVMEQLKNASDVGNNIKIYKTDEKGNVQFDKDNHPIEDASDTAKTTRETAQKASKDAWGKALGADVFSKGTTTTATNASTSDQLVTGKTLYDYDAPVAEIGKKLTYVSANNTTGQNLTALDAQVAANTSTLNDKTHNIKYYSVNDQAPLSKIDGYSNEGNDGAKGRGSIAAGFNTHADGVASTVVGSYSGVLNQNGNRDFRGATALSYGTFNINQNTDTKKSFSGVANSIIGQANATTNSNAAIIYGAGNTVTNSYRGIDGTNVSDIMKAASSKDVKKLYEALQKAVPNSGAQVMVMGGGNSVDKAYMTQVTGVGNKVSGQNSIYEKGTSTQYNFVDGFQNELSNGQHDYIIGTENKVSGDSVDKNQSNIIFGDNHKLTNQTNNVIIGSSDTADDETAVSDAVIIGHNAKVSAEGGVAIGSGSEATVAGNSAEGYNPKTGKASEDTTAIWKATNAAVSIGTADGKVTRQINGLAAGIKDTDAVNVAQLKKLEGMKANINASNIGKNLKGADGKTASPEEITANKNAWGTALGTGKVADPKATGETSAEKNGSQQLVTGGTVFNETRISAKDDQGKAKTYNYLDVNASAGKNLEALDSALKTVSTTAGAHTALTVEGNTPAGTGKDAKTNEDVYAGKNILLHESTDETTGKVTYDLKLSKDINIGKPGKDGEDGKIGIDGKDGHIGLNGSDGITVRGLDGKDGAPGKDGVTITGPKGEAGKDGIDGKVGISGKDGNDAVSISGKDGVGHIGLTGPAGTNGMNGADGKPGTSIDITVKNGYDGKTGTDGKDGVKGEKGVDGTSLTRIVYTDKTGEHQVATMEDGLKFKGDDDTVIAKKLNNTMEIIGGAKGDLTDGNIGVNSTKEGKLKVQLAKDLTSITSISNQKTEGDKTTGAKITLGSDGTTTISGGDVNVDGNKITNVGSGIEKDANGKYTVTDQNKGNAANVGDVQNMVNDAKTELTDGANGLNKKANIDASNIGKNLKDSNGKAASAEDQKANAEKWGSAIGTGEIKADDGRMVTGKTVYDEVRPTEDGNYVKKDQTTGENLSALDSKIGKLDKDGNYIKKDDSISNNLSTLDTQVKKNADDITNINKSISTLDQNAVKYDNSSKSKITLGGEGGTTITHVKDGKLSNSSTDAVNGKQLYNEQQAREKADAEINQKVTNNTNEITKIENGEGFTDAGKTVIKNLSKDAVQVKAGDRIKVDEATDDKGNKTYTISANNNGKVAKDDGNLISGDTLYKEVHVDKDGSYIKGSNTVGQNLSALDTGLKTTSDLIHTNDKGDTIQIGGNSTATKIDISGKDANGNTTGRVITGVVSDASDPNSAANVGYVNGLTAANTQQIYRDMNNAYSRLDTNINRAAAGSNALAALHPLDFDPADKASFAVGYGHYHNANAAAVGAFYQPNANTMVNMGISLGNGDPGFNAGVSFKIGKGSAYNGVSKAEMAQTIHDQAAEISTIKANDAAKDKRIDALEKENQEMKKQIQEILARLNG